MSGYCEGVELRPYQQAIINHYLANPGQKGLIANLATGLGKTMVATGLARTLYKRGVIDSVLVLTRTAVEDQFKEEIAACEGRADLPPSYYSVHSYEKYSGDRKFKGINEAERANKSHSRKRYLLILDEAHNVREMGTSKARAAYHAAKHATHVLLLTATVFFNHPADISFLMRLLDQPSEHWPADRKKFLQMYGTTDGHRRYEARMKNHIAYHHTLDPALLPEFKEVDVAVTMSDRQRREIEKIVNKDPSMAAFFSTKNTADVENAGDGTGQKSTKGMNAFMNKVRRAVNVIPGADAQPKLIKMIETAINPDSPKPVIIFTEFLKEGVEVVKKQLVKSLRAANVSNPERQIATYVGALTKSKRTALKRAISAPQESRTINYLIMSNAGNEGIDFKGVRQIHIFDPAWNYATEKQRMGRAIRVKSHTHLPPDQRNVMVYRWFSVIDAQQRLEDTQVSIEEVKDEDDIEAYHSIGARVTRAYKILVDGADADVDAITRFQEKSEIIHPKEGRITRDIPREVRRNAERSKGSLIMVGSNRDEDDTMDELYDYDYAKSDVVAVELDSPSYEIRNVARAIANDGTFIIVFNDGVHEKNRKRGGRNKKPNVNISSVDPERRVYQLQKAKRVLIEPFQALNQKASIDVGEPVDIEDIDTDYDAADRPDIDLAMHAIPGPEDDEVTATVVNEGNGAELHESETNGEPDPDTISTTSTTWKPLSRMPSRVRSATIGRFHHAEVSRPTPAIPAVEGGNIQVVDIADGQQGGDSTSIKRPKKQRKPRAPGRPKKSRKPKPKPKDESSSSTRHREFSRSLEKSFEGDDRDMQAAEHMVTYMGEVNHMDADTFAAYLRELQQGVGHRRAFKKYRNIIKNTLGDASSTSRR